MFALVEILRSGQNPSCCHAVAAVHFLLQAGKVMEQGRRNSFLLALDLSDHQIVAGNLSQHAISFVPRSESSLSMFKQRFTVAGMNLPVVFRFEMFDFEVAIYDKGEHRRLHPADAPQRVVAAELQSEITAAVHADDPVRF